jgi:hypothetical protein
MKIEDASKMKIGGEEKRENVMHQLILEKIWQQ